VFADSSACYHLDILHLLYFIVQVTNEHTNTCIQDKLGFDRGLFINNLSKIYAAVIWAVFLCYGSFVQGSVRRHVKSRICYSHYLPLAYRAS